MILFVTGPTKTGHVGTNITPITKQTYLKTNYLHFVTSITYSQFGAEIAVL